MVLRAMRYLVEREFDFETADRLVSYTFHFITGKQFYQSHFRRYEITSFLARAMYFYFFLNLVNYKIKNKEKYYKGFII